ncbi:amino acid adenylation domain-containing protein [Nostoc sp. BAE]|nr:amino acid adenylation domain-containing protein [Nostoc commune BAE]
MHSNSSLEKKPQLTEDARSFPLSYGQQAMWFLYQIAPQSIAYNIYTTVWISSELDLGAWQRAWENIIERHPILRTTYKHHEDQPVQVVHLYQEVDIKITDASFWDLDYLKKQILAEAERPYNLETGPVLRVHLFTRSATEHIQLLSMHHIAGDIWSFDILLNELRVLYATEAKTLSKASLQVIENSDISNFKTDNILPLPRQSYTDYVLWQTEMLASSQGEQLSAYWQKQLAGELPILDLPVDKLRPSVQTYCGATHIIKLDEDLLQRLRKLSESEKTSLYRIFLAAFFVLFYRLSGQEDILVGCPVAGRSGREEFEGIVGYFTDPVVLRANLAGNPTFKEFLAQIRGTVSEAKENQDYPFPLLVKQLAPERDSSRPPLFQVSLTWQKHGWYDNAQKSSLVMLPYLIEGHQRGAAFDIDLAIIEAGSEFDFCWQYNTDLFDAATVERIARNYQTLLLSILTNPEQNISALALLTEAEKHQLLIEWNNTTKEYSLDKCIHQLFEEQVEKTPDALAVVYEDEQLTYRELNAKANQLAHYLQKLGVVPEVLVGICVERSPLMIIALWGILKAGGAYLPLDPAYPSDRLAYMLNDSQAQILLTQRQLVDSLPNTGLQVICLDSDWELIGTHSEKNPQTEVKVNNLAYVIYTSGSTGKPKGVMIEHRSLVNFTQSARDEYGINDRDRILQAASISFDSAGEEIYPCLISGATLVLRTAEMLSSVSTFLQKCREWNLTVLILVTAYWHQLTSELATTNQTLPTSVRLFATGGENLLPEKLKLWQKCMEERSRLHNLKEPPLLMNGYGATEATIFTTLYNLSQLVIEDTRPQQLIGRAIGNAQTYILNDELQLVPIGVAGELHIGGVGLARGYLNRPDLTAAKFILHPFKKLERLYKTGDLARYLPDGNIEFLGRIDNQVKVRGFRIELGEIETVLITHPQVSEAVVIDSDDIPGFKRLVAYVVTRAKSEIKNQLRSFLKQKLPDYMVPSAFVILDALPLTPNGKIDRRGLPKPDTARHELEKEIVAPRTESEEILAKIWREVLHLEQIGIHDNFFELGGDSILSIQIIFKAKLAGLQLSAKQIFQHQTIAELAAVTNITQTARAEQGLVTGTLPLTPIQQWFFAQNFPEPHHFNQSFLLKVPQTLNPNLLSQIVQQLLLHHDALRLRFVQSDSDWQQINTNPDDTIPFSHVDISAIPETEQKAAIASTAASLQTSLNLSAGAIMRVAFFALGTDKASRLLIIIHHLAVDGVSWRILLEDLQTAYQQISRGEKIQLRSKTTSFKYWAERLNAYARSDTAKQELTYWQGISRTQITRIPVDYALGANTVASTRIVSVSLTPSETRALLQEVPKAYKTQINDILFTALVQTLSKWIGSDSVLLDLEGHGREDIFEDVDLSRTVGWFTTIFPVLLELKATNNLGDAIKSIKKQLRAVPNRGIGYGVLRYLSGDAEITSQLSAMPQPEVSFNYLGQFDWGMQEDSFLKLAPESMGIHHAITDGWSSIEFLNQLYDLYSALKKQEEITVLPAANVYKELVALEKEIISSPDASNFWKLHLRNYTYKPFKPISASVNQVETVAEEYHFDSEIIADLLELCRKLKVSPKAIFLSTYVDLIATVMKENTVSVGVISNGRTERLSDPFGALGLFWNIVPLCQPIIGDKNVQIKNVQESLIDIEPYVRYPLLQILLDQQEIELFFATFNFVNFHNDKNSSEHPGLKVHRRRLHDKFNFPLNYTVSMESLSGNASIHVEYDQMYFSSQDIGSMLQNYLEILKNTINSG